MSALLLFITDNGAIVNVFHVYFVCVFLAKAFGENRSRLPRRVPPPLDSTALRTHLGCTSASDGSVQTVESNIALFKSWLNFRS